MDINHYIHKDYRFIVRHKTTDYIMDIQYQECYSLLLTSLDGATNYV
jgi:hypothetical protein